MMRVSAASGRLCALLTSLVCSAFPPYLAAESITFADTFDGDLRQWGEARGRWQVRDGTLIQDTDWATAQLPFPERDIAAFRLTYRMRFDELGPAAQTGLIVDRGEGYWLVTMMGDGKASWAFVVQGEEAGLFHGTGMVVFRRAEWIDVEAVCRDDRLEMRLNGRKYIVGPSPGKGRVCLQSRRGVSIDDVKMTYDTDGRLYPNRQVNGSFEYATNRDVPDYWSYPGRWTRMNHGLPARWLTKTGVAEFRNKWFLDRTTAVHGRQSLRVKAPLSVAGYPMRVVATNDYLVSVYLKSDHDGMRVRLAADFQDRDDPVASRETETGTTWRRHTLRLTDYPHSRLSLSVTPLDSGNLWIDAVQIEAGHEPTDYAPSWYDAGFALPMFEAHHPPPAAYRDKTHRVSCAAADIAVTAPTLTSSDSSANRFRMDLAVTNPGRTNLNALLTVALEVHDHETQLKTAAATLRPGDTRGIAFPDFTIPGDRHRCRVAVLISDGQGETLRGERFFLDVPHPLRIYPEFSHYTTEKNARMAVTFGGEIPHGATLEITTRLALQRNAVMGEQTFDVRPGRARQLFTIPINTPGWQHRARYKVEARLRSEDGRSTALSECDLATLPPRKPDVRVNHINRGLYLNGAPYLPYGVYFTGALPEYGQLRFYRACGFDFIAALSHRSNVAHVQDFLANCGRSGLRVSLTHLSRKYAIAATEMARQLEDYPALILFNPVDETGRVSVYEELSRVKHQNPHILCYVNENTHGYQAFSDQLRGFPGEILSCDRYPLIRQPLGWPQTVTDANGIYSVEERIEWMDRDGKRDRKPLHFYLQAAEHTSREPTPTELTWLTYICLVNHCTAFTYFAGMPHSQVAFEAMIRLNREVQSLKPALFSTEDELSVAAADKATEDCIRRLAKVVGDELTIICVNRALHPIAAAFDLSVTGVAETTRVTVLFEDRNIATDANGRMKDHFGPLERHVYRLRPRR